MPKKWIIATNGSKYASEAVKYAAELCKDLKTQPEVNILVVAISDEKGDEAKAILEMAKYTFEDIAGSELHLNVHLETGEPGEVIVEQMKAMDADHLFIGGADFTWDVSKNEAGVSNYIIENLSGGITIIK